MGWHDYSLETTHINAVPNRLPVNTRFPHYHSFDSFDFYFLGLYPSG